MRKRICFLGCLTAALLLALSGRLYYIQIVCGQALLSGAESQQEIKVQSRGSRGTIYDRNMVRLTDTGESLFYLIKNEENTEDAKKLLEQIGAEPAGHKGEDYIVYRAEDFHREISRKLAEEHGAYVFSAGSRYQDDQIAAHLIGYVSGADKTGEAGLEKMFQYRLASPSVRLLMRGSGTGELIKGIGLSEKKKQDALEPSGLVTTLDAGIQRKTEEILREKEISGAVVVLDTATGQVLAMASSPSFNPNSLESYLDSDGAELLNKAVQGQYPPGSVFKIAVAAAALESGKLTEETTFVCDGSITVNGVDLICDHHPKGHGKVNFEEAFAKSCNGFFAAAAAEIGSETIIEMAQRLGLGQTVIDGFCDEAAGVFPEKEDRVYSGLANLAVGQGSLLATPLQIARMTNIIAANGIDYPISVVMKDSGSICGKRVMTESTARRVKKMMAKVCESGTASSGTFSVQAAGKTGSAESADRGTYTVHGWFTGFFPADDPAYTVTVLAENGKTGSRSALPVFEEIVNYLY
ncbi:MAG: penicillin-binding transpeptidase domain-containing protein [Emergencia sp.]|nr:penicillin-binding transpeptidase domain-containing protein [Emergencia sp.]